MTNHQWKVSALAALTFAALAQQSHAAGFMLTEQSALALGRSYAGVGVDGSDLSGTFYNPATMVLHKGTNAQVGGVGLQLNLDYANNDSTIRENGRGQDKIIPNFFFNRQINDTTWFGLGITVPYGMATEYDDNWIGRERGIAASILAVDINPNFAFKINEKFSIGIGASIQYAEAELKIGKNIPATQSTSAIQTTSNLEVDSLAWGYNFGFMYRPVESIRLGVSYRSSINHQADGDFTASANVPADTVINAGKDLITQGTANKNPAIIKNGYQLVGLGELIQAGTVDGAAGLKTPQQILVSGAWDINEVVSIYGTFRWADWSTFNELPVKAAGNVVTTLHNKWKDTYLTTAGMDLRLTNWWTLRGGLGMETSPISDPRTRTAIIPDAKRWWFSIGSSFMLSNDLQADVAFAHLHGVEERSLYASDAPDSEIIGKLRKLDAFLLGAQIQYKF